VIEKVLIVSSRAGRDGRVRLTANIQGGMTLRLMGPHSRLKERHEERKGEGPKGQKLKEGKRDRTAALLGFTSREWVWVYVYA
jgi:hypothetical protein